MTSKVRCFIDTLFQMIKSTGSGTEADPYQLEVQAVGGLTDEELRAVDVETVTIANGAPLSDAYDSRGRVGGLAMVPDGWTDANLGFMVLDTLSGTYIVAKDKTGVPIQISGINTTTGAAYAIPTELFPAHFVKVWSKHKTAGTETDVNQTGAKAIKLMLK